VIGQRQSGWFSRKLQLDRFKPVEKSIFSKIRPTARHRRVDGQRTSMASRGKKCAAQALKLKFNNKNLRMRRRLANRAAYRGVNTRMVPRRIAPSNRDSDLSRALVPGSARARIVVIKQTPHEGRFVCLHRPLISR